MKASHTGNAVQQLPGKRLYVRPGKRHEVVFFQEVINTLPEEFRNNTNVIPVVKAFQ